MVFCNSAPRRRSISSNMNIFTGDTVLLKQCELDCYGALTVTSLPEIMFFWSQEVRRCASVQTHYLVEVRLLSLATVLFTYKNLLSVADSSGEVQG